MGRTLYDTIGVLPTATQAEISALRERHQRFSTLRRKYVSPEARRNDFAPDIQRAYDTLCDPLKRAAYDQEMRDKFGTPFGAPSPPTVWNRPINWQWVWMVVLVIVVLVWLVKFEMDRPSRERAEAIAKSRDDENVRLLRMYKEIGRAKTAQEERLEGEMALERAARSIIDNDRRRGR